MDCILDIASQHERLTSQETVDEVAWRALLPYLRPSWAEAAPGRGRVAASVTAGPPAATAAAWAATAELPASKAAALGDLAADQVGAEGAPVAAAAVYRAGQFRSSVRLCLKS